MFTTKTGLYGTEYLQRALVTAIGLGANRPQDAVYPTSEVDADGKPYSGANKYVMHFDKGEMPPVDGFWSLTMYNGEYFFVDNPLNRYTVELRASLSRTPTARWISTSRMNRREKTKKQTGCPRPKTNLS